MIILYVFIYVSYSFQLRSTLITRRQQIMETLPAFIALSAAQSSAQTHIHSAIVVIDTSNNAWHSQVHWLVRTPYLAIKASNDGCYTFSDR